MKKNIKIILLFLILPSILVIIIFPTHVVPKGGGQVVLTSSIEESKKYGVLISQYYSPIFEYHDSLMNIKFDFTDAYIEYGRYKERKGLIRIGAPKYYVSRNRFFIAHFSAEAMLDNYHVDGDMYNAPIYYKWDVSPQYHLPNHEKRIGYGAIGRGGFRNEPMPDTISFVVSHNYGYYDYLKIKRPDIDFRRDTIGILRFVRK